MITLHEHEVKARMAERLADAEARRVRAQFRPRRRTAAGPRQTPLQ